MGAAGGLLLTGLTSPIALASPVFEGLCTPTDSGLEELSGLAVSDGDLYAVGDSGADHQVAVLDGDCGVRRWLPVPVDPRDVEDLAVGPDGRLWLADLGDNGRQRETVALISMGRDGGAAGTLRRLSYPDGPHDGEALLLGPDGVPVIVTKELLGRAGIYVPSGGATVDGLDEPGPSPLVKVGTVAIDVTETSGGPIAGINLPAITGGAVSADGAVAALRTYTDVYLYPVGAGGVAEALAGKPVRIPLPDQPQGEAIAFTADGDLLAGSEAAGGVLPPIMVLRGAAALAGPAKAAGPASAASPGNLAGGAEPPPAAGPQSGSGAGAPAEPARGSAQRWGIGIAAAVVLAAGAAAGYLGISRRRR